MLFPEAAEVLAKNQSKVQVAAHKNRKNQNFFTPFTLSSYEHPASRIEHNFHIKRASRSIAKVPCLDAGSTFIFS
jgi:hypothetical protein